MRSLLNEWKMERLIECAKTMRTLIPRQDLTKFSLIVDRLESPFSNLTNIGIARTPTLKTSNFEMLFCFFSHMANDDLILSITYNRKRMNALFKEHDLNRPILKPYPSRKHSFQLFLNLNFLHPRFVSPFHFVARLSLIDELDAFYCCTSVDISCF